MTREAMGWCEFFAKVWPVVAGAEEAVPARVVRAGSRLHAVWCDSHELLAEMTGRSRHEARSAAEFPATGDWVAVAPRFAERRATIVAVLPRRTCLSRKAAGDTANIQVLAANVDIAFIVNALDGALLVLFYSGWLVING